MFFLTKIIFLGAIFWFCGSHDELTTITGNYKTAWQWNAR